MIKLNEQQQQWVDNTLKSMSTSEKVGHLLCPENRNYSTQEWVELVERYHLGSIFFGTGTEQSLRQDIAAVQKVSRIPLLIAGDLEHGANTISDNGTIFPTNMAQGASGEPKLSHQVAAATAIEGRAVGINWSFSPVVDLNFNFRNSVTMTRAYSDRAQTVVDHACQYIKGMQSQQLMAATAKHFPGDGIDDRDQHRVTSINSLPFEDWKKSYGKVWQSVIDAGVQSIMVGHISLPDYQGEREHLDLALPATLCSKIQIELLRKEMGFEGLVVSDAAPMIGMSSRVHPKRAALENILAGSDIYLFGNAETDHPLLMEAVENGELPLDILDQRVQRVLTLKAQLCLNEDQKIFSEPVHYAQRDGIQKTGRDIAERALTLLRKPHTPPQLKQKKLKILCTTIHRDRPGREQKAVELPIFSQTLRQLEHEVDFLPLPDHKDLCQKVSEYDVVFANIVLKAQACEGVDHLGWSVMKFWRSFQSGQDNVFFTSFGSPYLLHHMPFLPNLLCSYSDDVFSQKAAAQYWAGELEAKAHPPVKLPKFNISSHLQQRIEMVDFSPELR